MVAFCHFSQKNDSFFKQLDKITLLNYNAGLRTYRQDCTVQSCLSLSYIVAYCRECYTVKRGARRKVVAYRFGHRRIMDENYALVSIFDEKSAEIFIAAIYRLILTSCDCRIFVSYRDEPSVVIVHASLVGYLLHNR